MGNLLAYSGLATKIRAMEKNLISTEEYIKIANYTDVSDIVTYLQHHPGYSSVFAKENALDIHRDKIEELLEYTTYYDFNKLYHFSGIRQRKYLQIYFARFEIKMLKLIIRCIFDHREVMADISVMAPFFKKFSNIDLRTVANSSSIDEFVLNLKHTEFHKPLVKLKNISNPNLFDYEICLDLFYFMQLWKQKDKFLKSTDLEIITKRYGVEIDLLNIQWIYRAKKYYLVTTSDINKFIIPISYKLKRTQLSSMIEAESIEELNDIVKKSYYGHHLNKFKFDDKFAKLLSEQYPKLLSELHTERIDNPEHLYDHISYDFQYRLFREHPYSLATLDTYLYLKETEVKKLINLIECIRYKFDVEHIVKILVYGGIYS